MGDHLTLIGFRYSAYTRIVRMALLELGVEAVYVETDPFAAQLDQILLDNSVLGRVPVLRDATFILTETAAITRYLAALYPDENIVPDTPKALARMMQVIGIVDAYGYESMVRKVFSHGFYRPYFNEDFDLSEVAMGIRESMPVLQMLEAIAAEGRQINTTQFSLADIHLAPMLCYFTKVPEAAALLAQYPALSHWWTWASARPSLTQTNPFDADK